MDLRRGIEFVRQLEKELVLFNVEPGDRIAGQVATSLDTQNVAVTMEWTASGKPANVAVLSDREGVLAIVDVAALRRLALGGSSQGDAIANGEYEEVLGHLKETTFTSYSTRKLHYVSREIEDRARRVGRGTLHAGFQRVSLMRDQRAVYTDLASLGIDVHAYGVPDETPPDLGDTQIHATETTEIEQLWFVVFDGGGDDAQKTALIAEQRDEDAFYGVWTYDATVVDHLLDHLERTYVAGDTPTRTES